MSACIIARHRAIGRPGVGGVAGRQGGGLSEGQAGSGRQAAQRTPPPREGAYLFLAIPAITTFPSTKGDRRGLGWTSPLDYRTTDNCFLRFQNLIFFTRLPTSEQLVFRLVLDALVFK